MSAEAYVNLDFLLDPMYGDIFSWLFNLAGQALVAALGAYYESAADLAGGGLYAPGCL